MRDPVRWLMGVVAVGLVGSVAWFVVATIHWPLTGDAALMHYVGFLMERGMAPYKEVRDINLPGSYVPAWVVSHVFGRGDLQWRLYDLGLLAVCGGAMVGVVRASFSHSTTDENGDKEFVTDSVTNSFERVEWLFPALWAGCLFALIHGRDGIYQAGQRDLAGAALMIVGVACLLWVRRGSGWMALLFGMCAGAAAAIKPTFAIFMVLVVVDVAMSRSDATRWKRAAWAVGGWMAPVVGCVVWLVRAGALQAFWYQVRVVAPYHRAIGHAPWRFLLHESLSPVPGLVVAWVVMLMVRTIGAGGGWSRDRALLLAAAGCGYVGYLVQGRGYPYHRYPFLVFLLVVMAMDFAAAVRGVGMGKWVGVAAVVWAGVVLAPACALKASRLDWRHEEFESALRGDLARIAAVRRVASLDGEVQCLDTISGCVATLDAMGVVQRTGFLYDEFLFNPAGSRAVDDARAEFGREMRGRTPMVIVVSAPLFPAGPDRFRKLDQWPEFRTWLDQRYVMEEEREFSTPVQEVGRMVVPVGYRVYVRR